MIDLLTCFLTFAFQSLENFTVCVGFVGMFGMFARPLPKQAYTQRTTPKPRKNKPPKRRKAKGETPRKQAKPKRKNPKVWATTPDYTPEQIFRIEEMFRRGRGY